MAESWGYHGPLGLSEGRVYRVVEDPVGPVVTRNYYIECWVLLFIWINIYARGSRMFLCFWFNFFTVSSPSFSSSGSFNISSVVWLVDSSLNCLALQKSFSSRGRPGSETASLGDNEDISTWDGVLTSWFIVVGNIFRQLGNKCLGNKQNITFEIIS